MKGSITVCGKEYSLDHLYNLVRKAYYKYDYGMIFSYLIDSMVSHKEATFSLKFAVLAAQAKWKRENKAMDSLDVAYENGTPIHQVAQKEEKKVQEVGVSDQIAELFFVHKVPKPVIAREMNVPYWEIANWIWRVKQAVRIGTPMPGKIKPLKISKKSFLKLAGAYAHCDDKIKSFRGRKYKESYYANKNARANYVRYADYQKRYREKVRKDPILYAKYKRMWGITNKKRKSRPSY